MNFGPFEFFKYGHFVDYLTTKMISNEKCLNYIVVGLIEIYSFGIKFISIRVHIE
jgi:hypothetical protein